MRRPVGVEHRALGRHFDVAFECGHDLVVPDSVGEGAEGVGRATTEAVVYSSISILIANFFLTLALGRVLQAL